MIPTFTLWRQGQEFGPYSREQLQLMYNNGELLPEDLVWAEGMPQWISAFTIFKSADTVSASLQATNEVVTHLSLKERICRIPIGARVGVGLAVCFLAVVGLFAGLSNPHDKFLSKVKMLFGRTVGDFDMSFEELKYDVQKTDSLVSPYAATLTGTIVDTDKKDPEKRTVYLFNAQFAFQNNKWELINEIEIDMVRSYESDELNEDLRVLESMAKNAIDQGTDIPKIEHYLEKVKEKTQAAEKAQSIANFRMFLYKNRLKDFLHDYFRN